MNDNNWQKARLVKSKMIATDVKSLTFQVDEWIKHKAGQHYDIRLTAENGYQAQRSYSIASAPEDFGIVEFGIQLLSEGEVSPYLFTLQEDDEIEIRGPLGQHFVWETSLSGPLILIGGGSGVVPLVSMLRHRYMAGDTRKTIFLISAQSLDHVLYRDELEAYMQNDPNVEIPITLTQQKPMGWLGYERRVDKEMLQETMGDVLSQKPSIYICGPTPFVEACASGLIDLAVDPSLIKTERFGG
ncbi:oxidoreductase [candidate division WWE3 bacterium]|nr:oxidoreductase [candidate division WWE3 bacterium]